MIGKTAGRCWLRSGTSTTACRFRCCNRAIKLPVIGAAKPRWRNLFEGGIADPGLGKDEANIICGRLIAGQMSGNRTNLLIAGEQEECRRAAVTLNSSNEIARLGVREFPPAMRRHGSAGMDVWIDQRTKWHGCSQR